MARLKCHCGACMKAFWQTGEDIQNTTTDIMTVIGHHNPVHTSAGALAQSIQAEHDDNNCNYPGKRT